MHRKKKIPVSFILAFIVSFLLAVSLAVMVPKFVPLTKQFRGMIFFGGWLILCFVTVGIVGLITRKNR